jgi:hypothetical protein
MALHCYGSDIPVHGLPTWSVHQQTRALRQGISFSAFVHNRRAEVQV